MTLKPIKIRISYFKTRPPEESTWIYPGINHPGDGTGWYWSNAALGYNTAFRGPFEKSTDAWKNAASYASKNDLRFELEDDIPVHEFSDRIATTPSMFDNRDSRETWLRIPNVGIVAVDPVALFQNMIENLETDDEPETVISMRSEFNRLVEDMTNYLEGTKSTLTAIKKK